MLWDRKTEGRFPEAKELKQRVRDVIDPGKDLGHSEASIDPTTGEEEYAPLEAPMEKKREGFHYLPRHVRHQHASTPRHAPSSSSASGSESLSARAELGSHSTVKIATKEEVIAQKKGERTKARQAALSSGNTVRGTRTGAGNFAVVEKARSASLFAGDAI